VKVLGKKGVQFEVGFFVWGDSDELARGAVSEIDPYDALYLFTLRIPQK
jgi:hypothetical protein